jgi:hypothetical protein
VKWPAVDPHALLVMCRSHFGGWCAVAYVAVINQTLNDATAMHVYGPVRTLCCRRVDTLVASERKKERKKDNTAGALCAIALVDYHE